MNDERRIEALSHMLQSARLACSYVEGMSKADFLADTRTQQVRNKYATSGGHEHDHYW